MLIEVSLQQYRAHVDTCVPLSPLTLLVGPNAVGKSSVLEALVVLGRVLGTAPGETSIDTLAGSCALPWLLRRGAVSEIKIAVTGEVEGQRWSAWAAAPSDLSTSMLKPGWHPDAVTHGIAKDVLVNAVALRLDARRLAEPSTSDQEVPTLDEDGYGLATVLSTLKLTSTDRFHALEAAARKVVPALQAIGFKRTWLTSQAPGGAVVGDELVLDFKGASGLPAHAASEGMLIALGILTVLYGSAAPRLLLLDNIERAIHPKVQRDLVAGLRVALAAMPETQIIATSHSPYLVDAFAPEEIVLLGHKQDGEVAARRLSDCHEAKWLSVFTTGELWGSM